MTLRLDPVRIALEDGDARLVFSDDVLVAVLVRLSSLHGADTGRWFLETAFAVSDCGHHTFATTDDALLWIQPRMAHAPPR